MTQQKQARPANRQHSDTSVRCSDCVRDGALASGNVLFEGSVRFDQQTANQDGGKGPVPLFLGKMKGSGPEVLLVENEILGQGFEVDRA